MPSKKSRPADWERREWAQRSRYDTRIFLCLVVGAGTIGLAVGSAADGGRFWWLVPPLALVAVAAGIAMVKRDRTIKEDIKRERGECRGYVPLRARGTVER